MSRDPSERPRSSLLHRSPAPCSPAPSACAEPWPGSGTQATPVTSVSTGLLVHRPRLFSTFIGLHCKPHVAFRTGGHTHRCLPFAKTLSGPPSAAFHWPHIAGPCLMSPARFSRQPCGIRVLVGQPKKVAGGMPGVHHLGPHLKQVPPLALKSGPAS